jgi:AP-2 complex subunit alpha
VYSEQWSARESPLSFSIKLICRTSTTFVKKKAALTLLRLYRKHPSVVPVDDWAERIVDMIGDRDPGVSMNAVTLVTTMAQDNLDAFQGCYKLVVERLDKIIFDGDYPSEYVYYKVSFSRLGVSGGADE